MYSQSTQAARRRRPAAQDVYKRQSLGLSVIAIDLSDTAIQTLRERGGDNPRFLCGDFINAPIHRPASYDYAYSRFTCLLYTSRCV